MSVPSATRPKVACARTSAVRSPSPSKRPAPSPAPKAENSNACSTAAHSPEQTHSCLSARVRETTPVPGDRSLGGYRFLLVERSELAPVLDPAVVEFIQGGVAVGVATRDDD